LKRKLHLYFELNLL